MSRSMTSTQLRTETQASAPYLRPALGLALLILIGFGLLYSLIATGITAALFPQQASGSLVTVHGQIIGSALVAQPFTDQRYFQPRPSGCDYDPMKASGSNQARSNPDLLKRLAQTRHDVAVRDHVSENSVADDLITQSGSGLDPEISLAAALQQEARVAQSRGLAVARVHRVVRDLAVEDVLHLSQPRVNVLELNRSLDRL